MEFTEIVEALKSYENTEDYTNYVTGIVTGDRVQAYLSTEDGKKLLQPMLDQYFNKGLSTWKQNNLTKEIDAEIKKRFPETDPKDIEIANAKAQIEALQREAARKDLAIKAQAVAAEKKVPVELVDYLIGEDEAATTANIDKLASVINAAVASTVEEKLKGGHVPPDDRKPPVDGVTAAFLNMNPNITL